MNRQKLLIIGFSCTDTEDGYASFLVKKLAVTDPQLSVSRCALGGLAPPVIPGTLKQILGGNDNFTHVLLEISTSIYSWLPSTTNSQALRIVKDIIHTVRSAGASPCFLMLPRMEKQPPVEDINNIIKTECRRGDVFFIDLASNVEQIFGRSWLERHYRDDVHTNEAGGRSQAGVILPSVRWFLNRNVVQAKDQKQTTGLSIAVSIAELIGKSASGMFQRKDYVRPYMVLSESDTIRLEFDDKVQLQGVSFVMGPWSGVFQAEVFCGEENKLFKIEAFDERSYYSRLGYRSFAGNECLPATAIEFKFHSRLESVSLIKGARAPFPSEIHLVDLFMLNN